MYRDNGENHQDDSLRYADRNTAQPRCKYLGDMYWVPHRINRQQKPKTEVMKNLKNNAKDLERGHTRIADNEVIRRVRNYCEGQLGLWGVPKFHRHHSFDGPTRMKWFVTGYEGNEEYIHRKLGPMLMVDRVFSDWDDDGFWRVYVVFNREVKYISETNSTVAKG